MSHWKSVRDIDSSAGHSSNQVKFKQFPDCL